MIRASDNIKGFEKSVVLGAGIVLHPCDPAHAELIKQAMSAAEDSAYRQGVAAAQAAMRKALGGMG